MFNFEIECSKVLKSGCFSIAPSFRWPNNRESLCGTEIWIWSEISFLRVDTINLMSARNGKVGRIYFLIVMPVYGTVSREGSIFSWLWLSPARATHLTGHMGASHQHLGAAAGLGRAVLHKPELEQSWSWLVGGTHRHGGRRGTVTRNQKSHSCSRRRGLPRVEE